MIRNVLYSQLPTLDDQQLFRMAKALYDLQSGEMKMKDLDKMTLNPLEAVIIRRTLVMIQCEAGGYPESFMEDLPFLHYNYEDVLGVCCENAVGYIPIPLGVAGQMNIDGQNTPIPMASTEGALIASVSRGCKAINLSGGVETVITADAITRAPCLKFPCLARASAAKNWLESPEGNAFINNVFARYSDYCVLVGVSATIVGNYLYPRFIARTGDAMGMNMYKLSWRCERAGLRISSLFHCPVICVPKKRLQR